MKVCIVIPANKPIKAKTVESLLNMVVVSPYEYLFIIATEGYTPSEKRNYGVVQALNNKCDYILFLDDDMVFPPETLTTLIERDKDVIGALYYLRIFPLQPVFEPFEQVKEIPKEPFMVKGVGNGLVLAKVPVLKKVKAPWFGTKVDGFGCTWLGDSYWFGDRVREAGFQVWCDSTLKIFHTGEYLYGQDSDLHAL